MTTGLQAVFIARTIPDISLGVSPKINHNIALNNSNKIGQEAILDIRWDLYEDRVEDVAEYK
jgi:hypothetical protein